MELAPRYCRSCGSRILVKNVCHNCNNDPLKGENYCYDCGALTPNANECLQCGAKYKTNFPVKPVLIIGAVLIIASALAGFLLSRPESSSSSSPQQVSVTQTNTTAENKIKPDTVVTKTIITTPHDTVAVNPVADTSNKVNIIDSSKTITPTIFTSDELKTYKIKCSYFEKRERSQVVFFIASGAGYIKLNDKIYQLDKKRKNANEAVFTNPEYETTVRIEGLSGNDKEWLSSCTLIIKDIIKNISSKYKVYSYCIEL